MKNQNVHWKVTEWGLFKVYYTRNPATPASPSSPAEPVTIEIDRIVKTDSYGHEVDVLEILSFTVKDRKEVSKIYDALAQQMAEEILKTEEDFYSLLRSHSHDN
jgi:hypothetical protein